MDPRRRTSMAEELARWIADSGQRAPIRTQYPIVPSMLPRGLLQTMLGTEFFRRTANGSENTAVSRRGRAQPGPAPG